MQLDDEIKQQLQPILKTLKSHFSFHLYLPDDHPDEESFTSLFHELCELSPLLSWKKHSGDDLLLRVSKQERDLGIMFYAIPNQYEFSSLILLLLNADGLGKNLPSAEYLERINRLHTPLALKTFILLTCPNCPEVVQALNLIALNNKEVTHSIYNTETHEEQANKLGIEAVPSVFVNGEFLHIGRAGLEVLLNKLELYIEGH